jgi:hypothetical protein
MQDVVTLPRDDQWKKLKPLLSGKARDRGATAYGSRRSKPLRLENSRHR